MVTESESGNSSGMKVEIDLGQLGFLYGPDGDGEQGPGIRGLIVQAAARQVVEVEGRELRTAVHDVANEMIREHVRTLVQAAFDEPIQRTTLWGEKQGEPTTVRELIRQSIEVFLKAEGRQGSLSNFRSDAPAKNLRELIDGETQRLMTSEMQQAIRAAKAEVSKTVMERAAQAIAEVVKK